MPKGRETPGQEQRGDLAHQAAKILIDEKDKIKDQLRNITDPQLATDALEFVISRVSLVITKGQIDLAQFVRASNYRQGVYHNQIGYFLSQGPHNKKTHSLEVLTPRPKAMSGESPPLKHPQLHSVELLRDLELQLERIKHPLYQVLKKQMLAILRGLADGKTYEEIGHGMVNNQTGEPGLSKQRIQQIYGKARRLFKPFRLLPPTIGELRDDLNKMNKPSQPIKRPG